MSIQCKCVLTYTGQAVLNRIYWERTKIKQRRSFLLVQSKTKDKQGRFYNGAFQYVHTQCMSQKRWTKMAPLNSQFVNVCNGCSNSLNKQVLLFLLSCSLLKFCITWKSAHLLHLLCIHCYSVYCCLFSVIRWKQCWGDPFEYFHPAKFTKSGHWRILRQLLFPMEQWNWNEIMKTFNHTKACLGCLVVLMSEVLSNWV